MFSSRALYLRFCNRTAMPGAFVLDMHNRVVGVVFYGDHRSRNEISRGRKKEQRNAESTSDPVLKAAVHRMG